MLDIIDKVLKEWPVIKEAPWSFSVAVFVIVCLVGTLMWVVINWVYSSRLAGRDGEIKLLERQRDDYKDKLGGASPEQAKILVAELRDEVESLSSRLQERYIEPDIADKIVNELRSGAPHEIQVTYASGDKKSAKFSDTIVTMLTRGGWKVTGPKAISYFGSVFDLSILVGPGGDLAGANLLSSIFIQYGIDIEVNINKAHENQCDLIVGTPSR